MNSKENLYKLRDIVLKHIPIGSSDDSEVKYLVHELERTLNSYQELKKLPIQDDIRPKTWVTTKDAVKYYGVSTQSIYVWRRNGKLKSRPTHRGKRKSYEYYLDPHIKEQIEEAKKYDKRWT